MMRAAFLTGLLACLLTAAGCVSSKPDEAENVIITSDKAAFAARIMGREGVVFWTPSKAEVNRTIRTVIPVLSREAPDVMRDLDLYRPQFFGVVVEGKKRVCARFTLDPARVAKVKVDPTAPPVLRRLGFQAEYDVELKRCLSLKVSEERESSSSRTAGTP